MKLTVNMIPLHPAGLSILVCFLLFSSSCKQEKVPSTFISEVKERYDKDQEYLKVLMNSEEYTSEYRENSRLENDKIIIENTAWAKEHLKRYGFPLISEVGKVASNHFWLICQHSDHDLIFQKKVLSEMEKKLNDVDITNYAYLYDRVNINCCNIQRFGTQATMENGSYIAKPLENSKIVDSLRIAVGLDSLNIYLDHMDNLMK